MCGFDAECVAIVANVRFFLRFFLIVATIVTHLRQNHTPFFTVQGCRCYILQLTCLCIVFLCQQHPHLGKLERNKQEEQQQSERSPS